MSKAEPTTDVVRNLLAETFAIPAGELFDDTPLFSSGRLDSFHLVELIAALEKASGKRISAGEVSLDNLDSPRRIAALLASKAG